MKLYLLLSKTDDECDKALAGLTRFSVRTAGCFAAYAAISVESIDDARAITERIADLCPGEVQVLMSAESSLDVDRDMSSEIPLPCIDPDTGQFTWDCLGSPEPSLGPKAAFFAVAVVSVRRGQREAAYAEIGASGGVTGLGRLLDPTRLLVELGATDRELLSQALDALGGLRSVKRVSSAAAVRPLRDARAESV